MKLEWRQISEYNNFSEKSVLIYCKKYGFCEAMYSSDFESWYIFRESETIPEHEAELWAEMPNLKDYLC